MYNLSAFGHNPSEDTERRTRMMKRFLCMALIFAALCSLAACGRTMRKAEEIVESVMPSMTVTPTAEPEAFSSVAPETPDPHEAASVTDVLSMIRDAEPEDGAGVLMNYPAAAKVLTFCADGGTKRETFERDVKAYFKTMDDAQKEEFRAKLDSVLTLAENIAKGDVEQSDLEKADLKDFDPVAFQHDNLETFTKTVRDAIA